MLYVSHRSACCEDGAFASICKVSRLRNAQLSTTGALLFDGRRFCQLLQGPELAVQTLMNYIARDHRHERLLTVFDDTLAVPPELRSWIAGFCGGHELDAFDAPDGLRGEAAMAAFRSVLSRADLSP